MYVVEELGGWDGRPVTEQTDYGTVVGFVRSGN